LTQALTGHAGSGAAANGPALGTLYRQVQQQSAMLSYVDVFYLLMIIVACSIPLIFLMRKSQAGAAMQGAA
jgi:MFS transporter, DHA2 family, multidrug resistance protein